MGSTRFEYVIAENNLIGIESRGKGGSSEVIASSWPNLFIHPWNSQREAFVDPDDDSPWAATCGPWRAVGVRKERLVFGTAASPVESASDESLSSLEETIGEGGAESAGTKVVVECLSDGGYVVELNGVKYTVGDAELDYGGELTATVDQRRVAT